MRTFATAMAVACAIGCTHASDYLEKPFSDELLVGRVKCALSFGEDFNRARFEHSHLPKAGSPIPEADQVKRDHASSTTATFLHDITNALAVVSGRLRSAERQLVDSADADAVDTDMIKAAQDRLQDVALAVANMADLVRRQRDLVREQTKEDAT